MFCIRVVPVLSERQRHNDLAFKSHVIDTQQNKQKATQPYYAPLIHRSVEGGFSRLYINK